MDNTQNNKKLISYPCPECDTPLTLSSENLILGKIIGCLSCGTENEIIQISPLKLSPLEEEK